MKYIYKWNELRYPKVMYRTIQTELFKEELYEYIDAIEPEDKLDALCDLLFLAHGSIWKLGAKDNIESAVKACEWVNSTKMDPVQKIEHSILNFSKSQDNTAYAVHCLIFAVLEEASKKYNWSNEFMEKALNIVTAANDLKEIGNGDPTVKLKGKNYIKPEPKLKELINDYQN